MNSKKLKALMHEASYNHTVYDVFRDFCEMSAIAISNAVTCICVCGSSPALETPAAVVPEVLLPPGPVGQINLFSEGV